MTTNTTPHLTVDRVTPQYWRVTFDHGPINTITAQTVEELSRLVDEIEHDDELNVVVFTSSNPDYFLAHYDTEGDPARTLSMPPGPTGMHPWLDLTARLSRAPVVSIASIRGRARGAGSELALATDIRLAGDRAVLAQFEVGTGVVPGGGPMARLPRLMGRGRALEVLLCADDIPGDLAELYGYVNRAIADAELDGFVESLATRIASFDKRAIRETKRFVDVASLPPDYEIAPEWVVCNASIMRPAAQTRIATLLERGLHQPGDVENRLGYHVGQLGADSLQPS